MDDAKQDFDLCKDEAENDVIRCIGEVLAAAFSVAVIACLLKFVKKPGIGIIGMKEALIFCGILGVVTLVGGLILCGVDYWADRRDCKDRYDRDIADCWDILPPGFYINM